MLLQNIVLNITKCALLPDAANDRFAVHLTSCWWERSEIRDYRGFRVSIRGQDALGDLAERFVVSNPPVSFRDLEKDYVNFDIVNDWIASCKSHHLGICTHEKPILTHGMKLVDCTLRQVYQSTHYMPYACLSYVWGQEVDRSLDFINSNSGTLPSSLPATIEDAITATVKLGLNYLWVDRYCIDQNNASEVSQQIGLMDSIYYNAEVTIVAAAGSDPSYGLPGVRSRNRQSNTFATIWNIPFLSTSCNPLEFWQQSLWLTRGWTYQEAFFSRRRLLFTEQQAYFECAVMAFDETFKGGQNVERRLQRSLPYSLQTNTIVNRVEEGPNEIFQHIQDYMKRRMTKPADIVDGIRGLLRFFERRYGIAHCWGTPSRSTFLFTGSNSGVLVDGLCWQYLGEYIIRREGFPSWSWAGWCFKKGNLE